MSGEAMAIGGNIVKGVGSFFAGQSNAKALRAASREELIAGAAQEAQIREVARKAIGEQVAGQFSNGFQGGTGSALDALRESAVNAAIDAMRVRREASLRAENLRKQGHQAAVQSWFDLASGLLGAGSNAQGMKADWAAARQGQSSSIYAPAGYGGNRPSGPTTDGSGMTGSLDRMNNAAWAY
jgi:hypothetical protein